MWVQPDPLLLASLPHLLGTDRCHLHAWQVKNTQISTVLHLFEISQYGYTIIVKSLATVNMLLRMIHFEIIEYRLAYGNYL